MFKILDGRKEFFQWDLEQKLIVSDPTVNEVHFSHQVDSESLVCEVYELDGKRVVNVPNILLQEDWKINVYAYCSNYTKISACFKVIPKAKPADYIYTETEVKTYDKFVDKVNSLPFEELTEDIYQFEMMKAGIYTAKPASGIAVKIKFGDTTSSLTLKEGATLIISSNNTIRNMNPPKPFRKNFLVVGYQTADANSYVRAGELFCKPVFSGESGAIPWTYEYKNGNILTVEDRAMNIDAEDTTDANIPSVRAVKKYVNEHGGARVLPGDDEAYIGDLETGVYTINGLDTGCCLWLDDYCEFGMLNGIAIITKDDEELYDWFFVGLDNSYSTVSMKGNTYFDSEEEMWTLATQGEVESTINKVNEIIEPDAWTYPTTKAVVDYVPKVVKQETEHKAYYSYNTTDLAKNKKDFWGSPLFSSYFTVQHSDDEGGRNYIAHAEVSFTLAEKQGATADIKYYVETPLKVEEKAGGYLTITNKDNLIDFGMFNLNGVGVQSLHEAMEDMVDGTDIYKYSIYPTSSNVNYTTDKIVAKLRIDFELYSRSEAVAQTAVTRLQQNLEAFGAKFLMLYHHIPEIKTIEAKYIGGSK